MGITQILGVRVAIASKEPETAEASVEAPTKGHHRVSRFWTRVFEQTDSLIYILVGICFFLAALLSLLYGIAKFGYSIWQLAQQGISAISPNVNGAQSIISFVSDLLLTLIIMEVLAPSFTICAPARPVSSRSFSSASSPRHEASWRLARGSPSAKAASSTLMTSARR